MRRTCILGAKSRRNNYRCIKGSWKGNSLEIWKRRLVCFGKLSRAKKAAEAVAEKVRSLDGEAEICQADISKTEDVKNMFDAAIKKWGRIDVLINNAGITRDALLIKMKEEDWDFVLNTNLKGAFVCTQQAAKIFIQQNEGHIINIASIVGIQGREGQANYSAAKAGLIGLTKAAAIELGEYNIRVNAVIPGYIPTEMGADISDKIKEQIIGKNVLKDTPHPNPPLEGEGRERVRLQILSITFPQRKIYQARYLIWTVG